MRKHLLLLLSAFALMLVSMSTNALAKSPHLTQVNDAQFTQHLTVGSVLRYVAPGTNIVNKGQSNKAFQRKQPKHMIQSHAKGMFLSKHPMPLLRLKHRYRHSLPQQRRTRHTDKVITVEHIDWVVPDGLHLQQTCRPSLFSARWLYVLVFDKTHHKLPQQMHSKRLPRQRYILPHKRVDNTKAS